MNLYFTHILKREIKTKNGEKWHVWIKKIIYLLLLHLFFNFIFQKFYFKIFHWKPFYCIICFSKSDSISIILSFKSYWECSSCLLLMKKAPVIILYCNCHLYVCLDRSLLLCEGLKNLILIWKSSKFCAARF